MEKIPCLWTVSGQIQAARMVGIGSNRPSVCLDVDYSLLMYMDGEGGGK